MKRTLYTTLLCSALLAACGGGGGDDQTPLNSIDSSSNVATSSPTSGVADSSSSGVTDGAANTAPVASAGADLGVLVGSLATLDGSGSSDANGDSLTYSWAFVSRPAGSSASLSGANTVSPSFTPDVAGPYVVSLTVNDGKVSSAADTVTVNAAVGNAAPVANAGADQNVNVGASVELDGSGSSDANGDTLSYTWAFVSTPVGSSASLSGSSTVKPTFTADIAGDYVVRLTVNDGTVDSASDSVTVNAAVGNAAPVANAGADQNVNVGASVTLDGSASSDADNDSLTYTWVFVSRPVGSSASLSDASVVGPSFTADVAGAYVVGLTVNDGTVDSTQDNVTVNAAVGNAAPVANAGADQNVNVGALVTLDGSASSDANGDTLTYTWSFASRPDGSSASLSDANVTGPSFTADVAGAYVLSLTVNDGTVDSTADSVTIDATVGSTEPVGFGDAPELEPPPAAGLRNSRGVSYCEGHRIGNGTIGNLEVPDDQSCVLESGVTVSNIALGAGAKLYAQGVYFNGNVNGQVGAARVVIEGSVIAGNLWLQSGGEITLRSNQIGGSIQANTNTGLVYLSGNIQLTGNIQLSTNTGGVTVIGNQVGADLSCAGNDPAPTGGDNVAASKLGQCADL